MNLTKAFLVLCLMLAVLTNLSDGFFLKKKLKKLLLAKALIKGPILAFGAVKAGKVIKAKAALPVGVGIGAGATALLGQSSGPSPAPKPEPEDDYYPTASVAPSAPAHSEGYVYSQPESPPSNYGVPPSSYGAPQQPYAYESPQSYAYASIGAAPQKGYGVPVASW